MKKRKDRPLLLLLLLGLGLALYAGQYYHADAAAEDEMRSDEHVQIVRTHYGWLFDGPGGEEALIFYPGAKVEETAYAPLLHSLAEGGMDVCLVRMPLHLAVLGMNRADAVMREHSYARWYVGGHSLGGACAAIYASENGEKLSGVVLLGAYSTKPLNEKLRVVLIYGSADGVLNREKYTEYRHFANSEVAEYVIEGGNHAQFGSYGEQKGDGEATVSAEEQVEQTVREIFAVLPPVPG